MIAREAGRIGDRFRKHRGAQHLGHRHEFVQCVGLGDFIPHQNERIFSFGEEVRGPLHRLEIPTNTRRDPGRSRDIEISFCHHDIHRKPEENRTCGRGRGHLDRASERVWEISDPLDLVSPFGHGFHHAYHVAPQEGFRQREASVLLSGGHQEWGRSFHRVV